MIKCFICKDIICKYEMDVGDTVRLTIGIKHKEWHYFCDNCSKQIAMQLIDR